MRRIVVTLAFLAGVLAMPSGAQACSCAAEGSVVEHAAAILESSDGAFIGVLKGVTYRETGSRGINPPGPDAIFRYRVRRDFGGNLGPYVRVKSGAQESACGLPAERGRRYAVGLEKRGETWHSSLCATTTPRAMRKAAADAADTSRAGAGCT